MTQPTTLLSPLKSAIPAQGGAIDIMVRVQGQDQPEASKAKITPKRLSLVVDRSGSMSGQLIAAGAAIALAALLIAIMKSPARSNVA
jgi:hypothetical protein